jgi:hypothetical protein
MPRSLQILFASRLPETVIFSELLNSGPAQGCLQIVSVQPLAFDPCRYATMIFPFAFDPPLPAKGAGKGRPKAKRRGQ